MKTFILKYLLVFSVLSASTWLIWRIFDYPCTGVDDANIFFVYAKHLASGHGFVYNIGSERVEGFSSLLWTLICALVFYLSAKPELTLLIVNIVILPLGITIVLSYLQSALFMANGSRYEKLSWSAIFLALLFASPAYIIWNTFTLMENAIWSTLLLCATTLVIAENTRSNKVSWIFAGLSVLLLITRPESFLWVPIFTAVLFARRTLADGITKAVRAIVPLLAVIAITVVILTIFRTLYFGYPLPNTYYAKVSPSLL